MPPPPADLPDNIVEEIFLRLPPDEPACLVRASLTSKLWLGLLTGHGFRGRYREFHGASPRLGFVYSMRPNTRFASTSKFGARILKDVISHVMDCRHGRVLLMEKRKEPMAIIMAIVVWDPMTGCRRELYSPRDHYFSQATAVLCAVTGCDHRACHHEGPFQVVFVGLRYARGYKAFAHVSLPEVGEWSDPCTGLDLGGGKDPSFVPMAPVLIQDAVYFMFKDYVYGDHEDNIDYVGIIKYDLRSKRLSLIDAPPEVEIDGACVDSILMGMEDGSLGFVHMEGVELKLWSRQVSTDQVAVWTPPIIIDLMKLLPIQFWQTLTPIGCVDRNDIIFVKLELGIYEINLKSLQWKKIWKRENIDLLIPYMSFYNRREGQAPVMQRIDN